MELNGRPLQVLVVEDNPADFVLLRESLLETPGEIGNLDNASTFDEAALMLREQVFDLIFLDLSLPDTNATETFSSLKPYCANIPVIILSGMADLELARKMIEDGAQDYLLKDNLDHVTLTKSVFYSIERARYNDRLRESEERYRDLFDMNPIPMYFYDEETLRIIRANQAAQVYYGYSEEEFTNMPMVHLHPAAEEQDFLAHVRETRNTRGLIFAGCWTHLK